MPEVQRSDQQASQLSLASARLNVRLGSWRDSHCEYDGSGFGVVGSQFGEVWELSMGLGSSLVTGPSPWIHSNKKTP